MSKVSGGGGGVVARGWLDLVDDSGAGKGGRKWGVYRGGKINEVNLQDLRCVS